MIADNDKSEYSGQWRNGKREGRGSYHSAQGDAYEGSFFKDKQHGRGTLHAADGSLYNGEWNEGRMNGFGECRYANGDVFTGSWSSGRRSGEGKLVAADGRTYSGLWQDDLPQTAMAPSGVHARAHYVEEVGGRGHLEGEQQQQQLIVPATGADDDDALHQSESLPDVSSHDRSESEAAPTGTMTYPDGSSFTGSWLAGKRHGFGKMSSADGSSYSGQWQYGFRHGHGKLTLPSGASIESQFKHDLPNGDGTAHLVNQSKLEGTWLDGAPTGTLKFTNVAGDCYTGELRRVLSSKAATAVAAVEANPTLANAAMAAAAIENSSSSSNGATLTGGIGGAIVGAGLVTLSVLLEADYEPQGRGKIVYASGDSFEGDFEAGLPHGFGSCQYSDGGSYTGDLIKGNPDGEGSLTYADNSVYRGELQGGRRHGTGRCTYASGATCTSTRGYQTRASHISPCLSLLFLLVPLMLTARVCTFESHLLSRRRRLARRPLAQCGRRGRNVQFVPQRIR